MSKLGKCFPPITHSSWSESNHCSLWIPTKSCREPEANCLNKTESDLSGPDDIKYTVRKMLQSLISGDILTHSLLCLVPGHGIFVCCRRWKESLLIAGSRTRSSYFHQSQPVRQISCRISITSPTAEGSRLTLSKHNIKLS
jgi:hypothetical protein